MDILNQLESIIGSISSLQQNGVNTASIALTDSSSSNAKIATKILTTGSENAQTLYQACSISKAITALAVATLIDQGQLSYSTKIIDIIPSEVLARLDKTENLMQYVTVASLLSHTSGLSQGGFPGYDPDGQIPGVEEIFSGQPPANTPAIRFDSVPGAQMSYSGGGYVLLQVLLEQLLGKEFPTIMAELVLEPLGMSRSRFGYLPAEERNFARAFVTGCTPADVERGYHYLPEQAAAGLWTTPTDLVKAVLAVQMSLQGDDGFLSQETAKTMLTRASIGHKSLRMALGWGADERFFAHAGDNIPGYTTYVFGTHGGVVNAKRDADLGMSPAAFAIMTNSAIGFDTIKKIVGAVFFLKGWPSVDSLPGGSVSMREFVPYIASTATIVDERWEDFVDEYEGGWRIRGSRDDPKVQFQLMPPLSVRPAAWPSLNNGDDFEQTFVVDGLQTAVRMCRRGGKPFIEVVQSKGVDQLQPVSR